MQVHAERTLNDDFKVTYTNHGKAYVPKISGTDMYRSYLSLMPEEEEVQDEATKAKIHEERQKILAHFQALTGQQQATNCHRLDVRVLEFRRSPNNTFSN